MPSPKFKKTKEEYAAERQSRQDKIKVLNMLREKERRECEESFWEFVQAAWKNVLEPENTLVVNWHMEYICHLLQKEAHRIASGEKRKKHFIINVPPRSLKSRVITVMWNAWTWIHYPHLKFLTASYAETLSTDHAVDTRTLVNSKWYQNNWGHKFRFTTDQNIKTNFHNDKNGSRFAGSTTSGILGRGGDCFVAGTTVSTDVGKIDISSIGRFSSYPKVLSYNFKTRKTEWRKIIAWRKITSSKPLARIRTKSGKELIATIDHRVFSECKGFSNANTLRKGDSLWSVPGMQRGKETVESVEILCSGSNEVYDIQVEGNHNFFANEILVHNCIIIDDPHDPRRADSEPLRQQAIDFYEKTVASRLNNPDVGLKIIVMQRLHELDLSGNELTKRPDQYFHICFPAKGAHKVKPKGMEKFYRDDYLFPERFNQAFLDEQLSSLGPYGFSGQYLQDPSPEEGGRFKKKYWVYWEKKDDCHLPVVNRVDGKQQPNDLVKIPEVFDDIINSWDMSFKDTKGSDYVVGTAWARKGANKYLLDMIRKKLDFPATVEAVKELKERTGYVTAILVEDKANGSAVISTLKGEIPGILPVKAEVSKEARAYQIEKQAYAGNIIIPHPEICEWSKDVVEEFSKFPVGKNDDIVDSSVHSCLYLSQPNNQVIGHYRWADPDVRGDFDVTSLSYGGQHPAIAMVGICQQSDLAMCHLLCLWDMAKSKLFVYDEISSPWATPDVSAGELRQRLSEFGNLGLGSYIVGDPRMFSKKPSERTLAKQYKKCGVRMKYPNHYDDNGAIAATVQMFINGSVVIHKRCQETDRQIREWVTDGGRPSKKDNGLAKCLCLVVSELRVNFSSVQKAAKPIAYGMAPPSERGSGRNNGTRAKYRRNSWQYA